MNWLNIEIKNLTGEEFLGESPAVNGVWLRLMSYCAQQENGGVIKDCANWKDAKWGFIVKVYKSEIKEDTALWTWKGNNLHVWSYPMAHEIATQAKRKGGQAKWRKPEPGKPNTPEKPPKQPVDAVIVSAAQEIRALHPSPGLLKEDLCAIVNAIEYEMMNGMTKDEAIIFIEQATRDYASSKDDFKYGATRWYREHGYQNVKKKSKMIEF